MVRRLGTLLLVSLLLVCVCSKGGRGGGSRSGGSSSRSSSRSSSTSRSSSSRSSYSYSRSNYRKSTILTVMTVASFTTIGYGSARYYRYDRNNPEYCVYCNSSSTNDTCIENKLVCEQSSDCYHMTYSLANSSETLIQKGCLYDPYGSSGCSSKEAACLSKNLTDCSCNYCSDAYCNSKGTTVQPVAGLLVTLVAVLGAYLQQ